MNNIISCQFRWWANSQITLTLIFRIPPIVGAILTTFKIISTILILIQILITFLKEPFTQPIKQRIFLAPSLKLLRLKRRATLTKMASSQTQIIQRKNKVKLWKRKRLKQKLKELTKTYTSIHQNLSTIKLDILTLIQLQLSPLHFTILLRINKRKWREVKY